MQELTTEKIRRLVEALPPLAGWPEVATIFQRAIGAPHPDWLLPLRACVAVRGKEEAGLVGAAAVACLQISIMIVDDILDDDPRGEHRRRGAGATANLAQAFQAAAFHLLEQAPVPAEQRARATTSLARAALATAYGQSLDVQNLTGEESYWQVIGAKSTPFYGMAYELGALLGGAHPEVAGALHSLGVILGEIIQIEDDLEDALEEPANPDWQQGRNNLLLLYARTADHPERERFLALLPQIGDPQALGEAQKILGRSGAISYAAYQLLARYQAADSLLKQMDLANPDPIQDILDEYGASLSTWLGLEDLAQLRELLNSADFAATNS
jgi:geranylgeranyl pyrophosphate synthase